MKKQYFAPEMEFIIPIDDPIRTSIPGDPTGEDNDWDLVYE